MFYQIFSSPQVKRYVIITYKRGTYDLPHDVPNELRLKILGNFRKLSEPHRMPWYPNPQSTDRNINFADTSKTPSKNRN